MPDQHYPDWICSACSSSANRSTDAVCLSCGAEPARRISLCVSCKHRHSASRPCHVWVYDAKRAERQQKESDSALGPVDSVSTGSLLAQEKSSSDESSSDESDDSAADRGGGVKQPKLASRLMKFALDKGAELASKAGNQLAVSRGRPRHHINESWGTAGCLKRCNCDEGVPDNHPGLFAPALSSHMVSHRLVAEQIATRSGPAEGPAYELEMRPWATSLSPPGEAMSRVFDFLGARDCAIAATVCTAWWSESNAQW